MELFWLIYLADLVDNMRNFLLIAAFGLVMLGMLGLCATCDEKDENGNFKYSATYKRLLYVVFVTLTLAALLPPKVAIYAYAGQTVAEYAVETPEVVKARELLNRYLDEALTEDE